MIIDIGIECPDIVYMYTVTSQASWPVLCTGKTGDTLLTAHVMTGRERGTTHPRHEVCSPHWTCSCSSCPTCSCSCSSGGPWTLSATSSWSYCGTCRRIFASSSCFSFCCCKFQFQMRGYSHCHTSIPAPCSAPALVGTSRPRPRHDRPLDLRGRGVALLFDFARATTTSHGGHFTEILRSLSVSTGDIYISLATSDQSLEH